MQRKLVAIALLIFLSLSADAKTGVVQVSQDPPLCGICFEQDNETLPDKHYFPTKEQTLSAGGGSFAPLMSEDALAISAQVWNTVAAHSGDAPSVAASFASNAPRRMPNGKHGEPSSEPADLKDTDWAWGGFRECNRGPEGKISAGCHSAAYDNLLCNSHYDECDDEFFALAVTAVKNADAMALRDLLHHSGSSTVVLNTRRSAIQLVGCSGDIVGHLPIDPSLLRALQ